MTTTTTTISAIAASAISPQRIVNANGRFFGSIATLGSLLFLDPPKRARAAVAEVHCFSVAGNRETLV